MAQFKVSARGSRGGVVTRLGSKNSGARASVDGNNVGVQVVASFDTETGRDVIRVYKTGGTGGRGTWELIAEVTEP